VVMDRTGRSVSDGADAAIRGSVSVSAVIAGMSQLTGL
jgi:predicted methyltransferase MtxX (methanogen marker protein 4)